MAAHPEGLIFNIQRYSLHDGSGIRTIVFFKGCPLRCPWCSNPESIRFEAETVRIPSKCLHCKNCAMEPSECPSGALVCFGKYMTVEEVVEEVMKDAVFYRTSGGGVTLSGGEVLAQADFAATLLKRLKSLSIHTAVETCGQGSTKKLIVLSAHVDTFLFDLKIMNSEKARQVIGADMNLILQNFEALVSAGCEIIPRVPLIPGFTDDDDNLIQIALYLKTQGLTSVHILPFHQYGSSKYDFLTREYQLTGVQPPVEQQIEEAMALFESFRLEVTIGGL